MEQVQDRQQGGAPRRPVRRRRTPRPMNIETVQRWVASVILFHVGSVPAVTLAVYSIGVAHTEFGKGVGLWFMSGVIGVLTAVGILLIFRRTPRSIVRSPWLLVSILPTVVTGFYIF
jgi:sterol desaturase/sphingolipid hydroxylase (fatty acid hydroxylase superfamily)